MLNFTVIKLSISLLFGIVLEFYFKIPVVTLLPLGFILLAVFSALYFRSKRILIPDVFFGISFILIAIYIGIFAAAIQIPTNQPNHYLHQLKAENENVFTVTAEVTENLKPTVNFNRYIISVRKLDSLRSSGKVLLNVKKDSAKAELKIGDIILLPIQISEIRTPLNPHQFNYKLYLERSGILHQSYSKAQDIQRITFNSYNLFRIADRFRNKIIKKLEMAHFSKAEFSIIKALLLGERRDISPSTYSNYASAGAIHILAISGLHIGILLWLITAILKPLKRFRNGNTYSFILTLLFLWGFALLTGLAPSVVRAVFMFSIIALGMQMRRKTTITNSLFISLFFLLLIHPSYVFQVGFQLSYLAMFGIIALQPLLQKVWNPKSRIILYFWKLLTVSFAAQMAVLPLSLYYFHQFPSLFFVTNLVILPFLGLILGLGLVIIILSLIDLLPPFLIDVYEWIILQMNNFVSLIASFENFIIKDISFSLMICLALYLLMFSAFQVWSSRNISNLVFVLCAIILLQVNMISEKSNLARPEAVIFHMTKESLIGIKTERKLKLYGDEVLNDFNKAMVLKFITEEHIQSTENLRLNNVIKVFGKKILVIDSSGIYDIKNFNPEMVLLRNSPKINLNRMMEELKPKVVVADGSNYKNFIEQWNKTLKAKNSHFHATAEKGAFIFSPSIDTEGKN